MHARSSRCRMQLGLLLSATENDPGIDTHRLNEPLKVERKKATEARWCIMIRGNPRNIDIPMARQGKYPTVAMPNKYLVLRVLTGEGIHRLPVPDHGPANMVHSRFRVGIIDSLGDLIVLSQRNDCLGAALIAGNKGFVTTHGNQWPEETKVGKRRLTQQRRRTRRDRGWCVW